MSLSRSVKKEGVVLNSFSAACTGLRVICLTLECEGSDASVTGLVASNSSWREKHVRRIASQKILSATIL